MNQSVGLIRRILVILAGFAAIGTPLWFMISALGVKFGAWSYGFGLLTLTFEWGPRFLFAALGLGAAALIAVLIHRFAFRGDFGASGLVAAFAAVAVGAGGLWYANDVRTTARSLPPIHDISTDTANPPQFSAAIIEARGDSSNSLDYAAKTDPRSERPLPDVQAEAYPDIAPITLTVSTQAAYSAALEAVGDMGWTLVREDAAEGVIEATAETFWFGFKDDVAIRITPGDAGGSIVDARSVSRVGVSDLGANAARLRAFEDRVRVRAG
ncbi:MAG: DUF1499 domain-containing protein [Pseudomonadota bacterium]